MIEFKRKLNKHSSSIICSMQFGSHLYGTSTPESDLDYKGIFMPTKRDILLGSVPKAISYQSKKDNLNKNGQGDIDIEYYSLPYFLHLACKGETAALDMLHCNLDNLLNSSETWHRLQASRSMFYTKSLDAFVGYCRKQAAKYGIKGSRLDAVKQVIDVLKDAYDGVTVGDILEFMPINEHCFLLPKDSSGVPLYEVCGRKFHLTCKADYMLNVMLKVDANYGERARLARDNDNIDWKAMSHAMRAAYQLVEIYTTGDLRYPLICSKYLSDIKAGKLYYTTNVAPELEATVAEVERLSAASDFPDAVDKAYWNSWLIKILEENLF